MKNISYKILIALLFTAFTSCSEEFLDTTPTASVAPDKALSTPQDMMAALNGVHRTMYAQNKLEWSNYAGESYIMPLLELNSGDMLFSTTGNNWFLSHVKWLSTTNPNSSDVGYVWQNYYYIIGSVNKIINAAEGMTPSKTLNNVLGQAYAYRAFAHHRLVSLFAKSPIYNSPSTDLGVPIMLKDEKDPQRSTVEEVYAQCEKDIMKSIEFFSDADRPNNKSHLSQNIAYGIAARIALNKGDYANAANYANKARQGFPLMTEDQYKSGFNSVSNPEWMWGATVLDSQSNYYYAWFYYIGTNFNGTQNRTNPKRINKKLFDLIPDTDYRKQMWLPKAPNTFIGWEKDPNYSSKEEFDNAKEEIINKYDMTSRFNTIPYMTVKFLLKNGGSIDPSDILYMRASEMYLIEAEALAKQGKNSEAQTVIEELGKARDKNYSVNARGLSLLEEIKLQRRIELWGEGHRWLDLLRYDEGIDLEGTGANPAIYQKGFKQSKPSTSTNWQYQIPQKEINANPNIKQNPSPNL